MTRVFLISFLLAGLLVGFVLAAIGPGASAAQRNRPPQVVVILSLGEAAELDRLTKDFKGKEEAFMKADEAQHEYARVLLESRGLKGEIELPRSNISTSTVGCWEDTQEPDLPGEDHDCSAYIWRPSADNKALVLK